MTGEVFDVNILKPVATEVFKLYHHYRNTVGVKPLVVIESKGFSKGWDFVASTDNNESNGFWRCCSQSDHCWSIPLINANSLLDCFAISHFYLYSSQMVNTPDHLVPFHMDASIMMGWNVIHLGLSVVLLSLGVFSGNIGTNEDK